MKKAIPFIRADYDQDSHPAPTYVAGRRAPSRTESSITPGGGRRREEMSHPDKGEVGVDREVHFMYTDVLNLCSERRELTTKQYRCRRTYSSLPELSSPSPPAPSFHPPPPSCSLQSSLLTLLTSFNRPGAPLLALRRITASVEANRSTVQGVK